MDCWENEKRADFRLPAGFVIFASSTATITSNKNDAVFGTSRLGGNEITMHRFLVVVEKVKENYSAYSPDLPGCIATGEPREEAEKNMHEAIELHVQGLKEDKLPIPESTSVAEYVVVR